MIGWQIGYWGGRELEKRGNWKSAASVYQRLWDQGESTNAKVAFKLDARTVKTLRRPNRGKRYSLLVAPLKLRRGAHRVTATVTFAPASLTKPKRLRVTFRHCARPAAPSSSR